jgi:hypothetical protein
MRMIELMLPVGSLVPFSVLLSPYKLQLWLLV